LRYLLFVRANLRLLSFGAAAFFFSSFGQTFFVSLFNAPLQADLGLGSGDIGLLYSAATLLSALSLMWLGRKIDEWDLRSYTVLACALVVLGAWTLASAPMAIVVAAGFYFLRIGGQGLLSHAALTSMGRYFTKTRGRAIGLASLGFALGEAVLPLCAVALTAWVGWRQAWGIIGTFVAIGVIPILLWLLRGQAARHRAFAEANPEPPAALASRRLSILRDLRFYLCLPTVLAPPFVITGLFFHQTTVAAANGWSLTWLASCFIAFAVVQAYASFQSGVLVDRIGAVRLLPFYLAPMACGLLVLAVSDHPVAALLYMIGLGLTAGLDATVGTSAWAELFGVQRLGAIRATAASLMVFSTALSPVLIGWALDRGVTISAIAGLCILYCGICLILALRLAAISRSPMDSAR
jgi:MFS family permease